MRSTRSASSSRAPEPQARRSAALGPQPAGSIAILITAAAAMLIHGGETPAAVARSYAIFIGIGLVISIACDLQRGIRNLIRADLLCLIALYFLTLTEFLFPQPDFDHMQSPAATADAADLVVIAFATFAMARHGVKQGVIDDPNFHFRDLSPRLFVGMLLVSALLGFLHMFVAVNFNPFTFFEALTGPRFNVPWGRGRLGDWKDLLNEFALFFNVIPPLAGALWHKRRHLSRVESLLVIAILLLTLFTGFCSGTRNVLAGYLAAFLGGYLLTHPRLNFRAVVPVCLAVAVIFMVASYHMLEFRNMGLRRYVSGGVYSSGTTRETLFVDYNLHAIAELTKVFPQRHDYLGAEVPIWALIKPIPRALWSGKPEGLSIGIEEAMGEEGLTIATTYIGEAYVAYGTVGVVAFSVLFAAAAAAWNRVGSDTRSSYSIMIFASGLAAFAITMRSMFWFTTAILPAVALVIAHRAWVAGQPPAPRRRMPRRTGTHAAQQPQQPGTSLPDLPPL